MEYLDTGSADCPIIRLYNFTPDEVGQLCGVFASLASGAVHAVALHEQSHVQPIEECRLTLGVAERDQGIVKAGANSFDCMLTGDGWQDQKERVMPLTSDDSRGHFLWLLYDIPSEVRLLLSSDGSW